ncbi:MAG: hypothetical protein ACD_80C00167G0023 [uncultured bacterium (gcode 4)]|uniref:Uncharacterized protein n=1 Tax=uncultured bacterium (gcode 4) TaxID=1234023 RepID=K1X3T6_9BACT|nr:MAG: hypothetical protein ACD_80C00167G0023 [uncultured bacterium (gcode 4)]HBB04363.1 hypothetical protein [Candidatus Gracilibacteria bacterium]
MAKRLNKTELQKLIGQEVFIEYEEMETQVSILSRIKKADDKGIIIQTKSREKAILMPKIKQIYGKNIILITPKKPSASTNEMDKLKIEIIEKIKSLPEYHLSTRSAKFTKNGSFKKKKISQKDFESEVFHWIDKREEIVEFCPLVLLNNKILLALYNAEFVLLKKDFTVVTKHHNRDINTIVKFITDYNKRILEKKIASLKDSGEFLFKI